MKHHTATLNENQAGSLSRLLVTALATALGFVLLLGAGTASAVVIRGQVEAFGPDGTAASSFGRLKDLAFNQNTRGLYAVDAGVPGAYGFGVSALPTHSPLTGFSPLSMVAMKGKGDPGIAVDNTALSSAGNVYLVSEETRLVYGFDKTGAPLGGNFPIDPTVTPGAPFGSPVDICGAAVDSTGNVWVANFGASSVLEYNSAGVYQGAVSTAAQGFHPCSVSFDSNDDMYVTNGGDGTNITYKYTASSGYTAATLFDSHSNRGNAVDRLAHHVFLIDSNAAAVNEFDSAGNPISTTSEKDATGDTIVPTSAGIEGANLRGVTIDSANNRLYVADESAGKIRVFGDPLTYPDLTLGTVAGIDNTSATASGAISAQGVALSDCHFEYVSENAFEASGFSDLSSGGSTPCSPAAGSIPADSATHSVSASLSGLSANTGYRFRLVASNANGSIATLSSDVFETSGPPLVETTGSPLRTKTTARLDGRVNPERTAATYHFEYGEQGPCDSNPCTATEPQAAGSGGEFELVSQQIEGLQPNTTYHYRLIADNGNSSGPTTGEDMTLTTRGDEAPLSHGHFSGPVGSDRAWELVSAPDTGGNPVGVNFAPGASTISDAGDRVVYGVAGGTPDSETGTFSTRLFAERTPSGWQTRKIFPRREDATSPAWEAPGGPADLSSMVVENHPTSKAGEYSFWRLTPDSPPAPLFRSDDYSEDARGLVAVSDADPQRVIADLKGPRDPAYPGIPGSIHNFYDIGSGSPRMISLLPDGQSPACGVSRFEAGRTRHYASADGTFVFFPTEPCGPSPERLYVRDLPAEETKLISTPPVSGQECGSFFIKSIPGSVFFYTQSRLVAEDVEPGECKVGGESAIGGDVYRYDIGDGAVQCLTCLAPGLDGEVIIRATNTLSIYSEIGVAEDGSRVYFRSSRRLLPGAPRELGTYRLDVASGKLAYVGDFGPIGDVGGFSGGLSVMNANGAVVAFKSNRSSVNSLGGQQNGGTMQFYRYDDRDRSLVCVSCPPDGSVPQDAATDELRLVEFTLGANIGVLSRDGEDFAFTTPMALTPADQNTAGAGQDPAAGTDVYEWRDGHPLLVSDGLTNWPVNKGTNAETPVPVGITPSGRDIFFTAAAQLTHDALDGYRRLYDARIGGGFEFPPPPKPCPLEVCQGTPKGAPEEQAPGSGVFAGPGNVDKPLSSCRKGKVRRKGRCVAKKPTRKHHSRAKHNRRAAR